MAAELLLQRNHCHHSHHLRETPRFDSIPEAVLEHIFGYIDDACDRSSISLVCKEWKKIDTRTRKCVTIAMCYSVNPSCLTRRFHALESIKIKGKPRAAMFRLVPDEWGGHATPWISEISRHCRFLKSVHLRRMVVTNDDLSTLARYRGEMLQVLKLERCTGFSTRGLHAITRSCRSLKVLFLEESIVTDEGDAWLHEISVRNTSLEVLNVTATDLKSITIAALSAIAAKCKSLTSLKLSDHQLEELGEVLGKTTSLKELGGVSLGDVPSGDGVLSLPATITSLVRLYYFGANEGDEIVNALIKPIAPGLKKIDLQCACLTIDGHCQLLGHCAKLEALEVVNAIGDEGLEVIANNCKNLRWLRVERGDREFQQGFVTQKGLISVASNCHQLEYIAAYVSDINNAALAAIATNCPKLKDFRLVLLDEDNYISEYPLDQGVRALMQLCPDMHRFALYLRHGFLTDKGMEEIGMYGKNLRWILFGLVGESDNGLKLFANGCPNLQRLEIRDCVFSEAAITESVLKMQSLKYVWIQGYKSTGTGRDLLPLTRAFWSVELIRDPDAEAEEPNAPAQFLAYRSLVGKRDDAPETITCLG